MVISLNGISEERKSVMQEFAEEFGLRISEFGTEIVCCESDDLTAEYDGNARRQRFFPRIEFIRKYAE